MQSIPIAVTETTRFSAWADRNLSEDERQLLTMAVASEPTAGVLIPGLHGLRKLRWRRPGSGKRGGYRVIYYFHSDSVPIFLVAAYSKASQEDLSPAEKASLKNWTSDLKRLLKA
jgi:hypothetical protein